MSLQLLYDKDVDVLRLFTGEDEETSSSLLDLLEVVVHLTDDESRHVVGLEVIGASSYLPLGRCGYDTKADTLTLGATVSDPANITENADIVTYWQESPWEPGACIEPVGVTIRRASKHLKDACR